MSGWDDLLLSREGFVDPMAEAIERINREMAAAVWGKLFWGPEWRLGAAVTRRRAARVRLNDLAARLRISAALIAEWQEAKRLEDNEIPLMPSRPLVIPFWGPQEPPLPPPGTRMKWSREDIRRQAVIDARQAEHQRGAM